MSAPDRLPWEVRRDWVRVSFFSDGSGPAFYLLRGDTGKYIGVNERLEARDRGEALIHNRRATTLPFKRNSSFVGTRFLLISSDLGRAFAPQPWAAGVLPILPVERLFAFAEGAARDVLEFSPEAAQDDVRLVAAYALLLLREDLGSFVPVGSRTQDLTRVLCGVGVASSSAVVRRALDDLARAGEVEAIRLRGPTAQRTLDDSQRYWTWRVCRPPPFPSVEDTARALANLWEPFVPYLKVPSVTYSNEWWQRVRIQGPVLSIGGVS